MRISGRTSYDFISSVGGGGGGGGGDDESGGEQISARISQKQARFRRGRNQKGLIRPSLPSVAVVCILLGLTATVFAFRFLSPDREIQGGFDGQDNDDDEMKHELRIDLQTLFNKTIPSKELRFGRGSITGGRDSRYWDRDDRRRDDEYDEDVVDDSVSTSDDAGNEHGLDNKNQEGRTAKEKVQDNQNVKGLYNEADRQELKKFEKKYEESLYSKLEEQGNGDEVKPTDEYDDGLDMDDDIFGKNDNHEELALDGRIKKSRVQREMVINGSSVTTLKSSLHKNMDSGHGGDGINLSTKTSGTKNKPSSKGRKRRSSCEMKLLDTSQLIEPLVNKKFSRFSLQYKKSEDRPDGIDNWVPLFAGHQSLQEREESFYARDQIINCGFVKGPEGSPSTGFDMAEDDMNFMSSCHIAVSSCIFGNSDHLRTPYIKMITRSSRKNVCFVMFMDENTLQTLSAEGQQPDSMGFIGLWKIVVVKNLPYDDMRRVGKIPKFLTHRLFPSARYSIWLDSKLRLQSDPLLILEYFLWRKGYEYAISNHYDRHCVWEEVMQNKKLNKFNHTIIDQQFEFYQADGLKRFDLSDPNRLLPSYVPEGSFIMRAHTPMSNLFSCLWFNEVDRFTPRDQLSFAYTFMKLRRMNSQKTFHLHMFKDCERRSIAKLFRHREVKRHSLTQEVV